MQWRPFLHKLVVHKGEYFLFYFFNGLFSKPDTVFVAAEKPGSFHILFTPITCKHAFSLKPAFMKPILLLFCTLCIGFSTTAQPAKLTIFFDNNEYKLSEPGRRQIDSLAARFLQQSVPGELNISGHCDNTGTDTYNMALSEKRIQSVTEALNRQLAENKPKIIAVPRGEFEPVADNHTNEGKMQNRRVEISFFVNPEITDPNNTTPVASTKEPIPLKEAVKQSVAGDRITLRNLNFQGGLHRLLPSSAPVLNELLQTLKDNPALEIDIQGHICCLPGPEDGYDPETATNDLSVQRAKTVYDFLVNNGIDKKRLYYRGFGHQYPLTAERTPDEEEQNRRVEIKIIRK